MTPPLQHHRHRDWHEMAIHAHAGRHRVHMIQPHTTAHHNSNEDFK